MWSSTVITTRGDDAHGLVAQSVGGGGTGGFSISGGAAASAAIGIGIGGSGGEGGNAGDVSLTNVGRLIRTEGDRSYGAVAQSVGGSGGNGGFSLAGGISNSAAVSFAMGGSGGKGSVSGNVVLTSSADVVTLGNDAHGLFAQSVGGSGGSGGFAITGGIAASGAQIGVGSGGVEQRVDVAVRRDDAHFDARQPPASGMRLVADVQRAAHAQPLPSRLRIRIDTISP